jgi:formamidopyrimidine-DNA glycosylase
VPEILEVERYRRMAAATLGRVIAAVDAPDPWFLKAGLTGEGLAAALTGRTFVAVRRIGKLLLLDVGEGPTIGLRFGMTGVLEVDGDRAVERLEYASPRRDPTWERFAVRFADGGHLRLSDPRRLGAVELDPDESRLGVDALTVTPSTLRRVLADGRAPLKARMLDQSRLAGVGNLLADEILWRAGLDPARPAGSLSSAEARRLHRHLRATLDDLAGRGGSHTGDLMVARVRGGTCPRDGAPLLRHTVGGRTTYSCPRHQR